MPNEDSEGERGCDRGQMIVPETQRNGLYELELGMRRTKMLAKVRYSRSEPARRETTKFAHSGT